MVSSLMRTLTEPSAETARRTKDDVRCRDFALLGGFSAADAAWSFPVISSWLRFLLSCARVAASAETGLVSGREAFWLGLSKLEGGVDKAGVSTPMIALSAAGLDEAGGSLSFKSALRSL